MADRRTSYDVDYIFQIEIDQDDDEGQERKYRALCSGLSGCQVRAPTKAGALRKIRQAIDAWLDYANGLLGDDVRSLADLIESRVED